MLLAAASLLVAGCLGSPAETGPDTDADVKDRQPLIEYDRESINVVGDSLYVQVKHAGQNFSARATLTDPDGRSLGTENLSLRNPGALFSLDSDRRIPPGGEYLFRLVADGTTIDTMRVAFDGPRVVIENASVAWNGSYAVSFTARNAGDLPVIAAPTLEVEERWIDLGRHRGLAPNGSAHSLRRRGIPPPSPDAPPPDEATVGLRFRNATVNATTVAVEGREDT